MERLRQNEIVLVPFPFSDGKSMKVRPALVVSGNAFNSRGEDVILCAITTRQVVSEPGFVIRNEDLSDGSLVTAGFVRVGTIARFHKSRVLRRIATAKKSVRESVEQEFLLLVRK